MVATSLFGGDTVSAMAAFAELAGPAGRCGQAGFEALVLEGDPALQRAERQELFRSLSMCSGYVSRDEFLLWLTKEEVPSNCTLFREALKAWTSKTLTFVSDQSVDFQRLGRAQAALVKVFSKAERVDDSDDDEDDDDAYDPWSFAVGLAVLAHEQDVPWLSDQDRIQLKITALQGLPRAVSGLGAVKRLATEVTAQAAAASVAVHPVQVLQSSAVNCLTELSADDPWASHLLTDCKAVAASLEKMQQTSLSYLDPRTRREAADAIIKLMATGGDELCEWFFACLAGPDGLLKQLLARKRLVGIFVLDSIMEVVQTPQGWKHLFNCLLDLDPEVRGMACQAAVRLVSEKSGSSIVMPWLSPLLNNEIEDIRCSAMEIALAVARHEVVSGPTVNDAATIGIRASHDQAALVQDRGLQLLGAVEELHHWYALLVLATKGGEVSCSATWEYFADAWQASESKDKTFQGFLPEYRDAVRSAALRNLSTDDVEVLKCVVELLRCTCDEEDEEVATAVRDMMIHRSRQLNAKALGSLIGPVWIEGTAVHAAALLCLRANWTVQRTLLQALGCSAPCGCAPALKMMMASLESRHEDVRQSAIESIASIAWPGDMQIVKVLQDMRDDDAVNVQDAAEEALRILQDQQQPQSSSESYPAIEFGNAPDRSGALQINVEDVAAAGPAAGFLSPAYRSSLLELVDRVHNTLLRPGSVDPPDHVSTEVTPSNVEDWLAAGAPSDELPAPGALAAGAPSDELPTPEALAAGAPSDELPTPEALAQMPMEDVLQAYDKVVSRESALEEFVQWPSASSTGTEESVQWPSSSGRSSSDDSDDPGDAIGDCDAALEPTQPDCQEAPAAAGSDWVLI